MRCGLPSPISRVPASSPLIVWLHSDAVFDRVNVVLVMERYELYAVRAAMAAFGESCRRR